MPAYGAEGLRIGGTGNAMPLMRLLADAYRIQQPNERIEVLPSLGSSGGIKAVLAGAIDLAVSGRTLKSEETAKGAQMLEFARTPFVFAVATATPVDALSLAQVADIYAGRLTLWSNGERIRPILRPVGDADSEAVKAISPALRDAKLIAEARPGLQFAVTDQDAADALERSPGAFGTSTLGQILSEGRHLRALRLEGVTPSLETLGNGRYVHVRHLYLVTTPTVRPATRAFLTFVHSPAGRELLLRYGYLPVDGGR